MAPNLTMDYNEIRPYVDKAIEQLRNEGNSPLYQGLVIRGAQIALGKIRELNRVASQIGPVENRT